MALRILRYLVYGVIAFLGISLVLVFLFRFVPVPYTAATPRSAQTLPMRSSASRR